MMGNRQQPMKSKERLMNTSSDDLNSIPWTLVDVFDLIQLNLNEYERNPPQNDFYRGYQWAFENLRIELLAAYRANPTLYPGGCDCPDCMPNRISDEPSPHVAA
jgi:hypothetical protein